MAYVIGERCADVVDRGCVRECPVGRIHEGGHALCIHPDECVDRGACVSACPVEAIYYEDDPPAELKAYHGDSAAFFFHAIPGHDLPLRSPGGAAKISPAAVDAPLVARLPKRSIQR
ncbi:4Fe-4S dicluster domain-containing protein [Nocardia aurantiaca]|uniref:Ferredoxin n=1 Tax=Nocardia aurantiaca TaxID=2675850 RepID=A0A6I3L005_9NOCA|nr:ferredoxin family protein [Nocardia aurantiaca]MTE15197.1 ferredoxin family protein [Nocardia aurantiaca]